VKDSPTIRLHLPTGKFHPVVAGAYDPAGWVVCVGNTRKPAHRCLWQVVGFYSTLDAALRHYRDLAQNPEGRALFEASNPRLTIVTWGGRLWRSIEQTEKLLR
jgi:hypothetical protein